MKRRHLPSVILTGVLLSATAVAHGTEPDKVQFPGFAAPPPVGPYISSRPFLDEADRARARSWYPEDTWGGPSRPYVGPGRYWSPPESEVPRRWNWGAEPVPPADPGAGDELTR